MRKIFFLVIITCVASLFGEIPVELENYMVLECQLEPVIRAKTRHKDKDNLLPSLESNNQKKEKEKVRKSHGSKQNLPLEGTASSLNWSGYIAQSANNSVTRVAGSWTVPKLAATSVRSYSSVWVGIDGYTSNTIQQMGTEHDYNPATKSQTNYAWVEMYPGPSYIISGFPTNIGDVITGEIKFISSTTYHCLLVNHTRKICTSFFQNSTGTSLRNSAEWIVEAPYLNGILPLANFGTIALNDCEATIGGYPGAINSTRWTNQAIQMVTTMGTPKGTVSGLSPTGGSFSVTWAHL